MALTGARHATLPVSGCPASGAVTSPQPWGWHLLGHMDKDQQYWLSRAKHRPGSETQILVPVALLQRSVGQPYLHDVLVDVLGVSVD